MEGKISKIMKIKEGDKIPDAKVFILEKDPKEVFIKGSRVYYG